MRRVRHRGPDGTGFWVSGSGGPRSIQELDQDVVGPARVALGFSRLAILDLTPAADQPIVVPGRASMVFNGEIYNYVELREELRSLGWSFTSTGDSEVLLKAYLEWGVEALPRLEGMWAVAVYDEAAQALLLSRDRFGERPLWWTPWRDGIAFASEVKQLRCYPGVAPSLDRSRAAAFLVTGRPYDGPSSWFEGIRQLEPGSWLRIDRGGIRTGSYFDLEREIASVSRERSARDWAVRFEETLSASVRRRLRSDVPVGTSLSSGIDSSMILAEATAQGLESYRTFTLCSDDPIVNESDEASRFAERMGSIWHPVWANPSEFASLWDRLTWHQECPVAGTSLYGQWKVFETARANGVVVVLDGQGADEILGGYNKFVAAILWRTAASHPTRLAGPIKGFIRQVGTIRTLRTAGYRYLGRMSGAPQPTAWLRPGLYEGDRAPRVRVTTLEMRLEDIRRWSLPNLLAYADRNSMAHSVETRLPYLDPGVVTLSLAMPDDVLFRNGWTKWPLRVALARRAGPRPAWSPGKRWFGVPQAQWLRGSLSPYVDEWVADPHPAWEEIAVPADLGSFKRSWASRRASFSWDDQVFKMVSLDRFLRLWFP